MKQRARFIQLAMVASTLLYALVVGGLYLKGRAAPPLFSPRGIGLIPLSIFHLWFFLVTWKMGGFIDKVLLRAQDRAAAKRPAREAASQKESAWLVTLLIKLAMREASALLGLTLCLIAIQTGALYAHPLYALNAFSAVIWIVTGLATLPSGTEPPSASSDIPNIPTLIR